MTLEAVVFDLDGTLVDTLLVAPAAYAETVRALGGQPQPGAAPAAYPRGSQRRRSPTTTKPARR